MVKAGHMEGGKCLSLKKEPFRILKKIKNGSTYQLPFWCTKHTIHSDDDVVKTLDKKEFLDQSKTISRVEKEIVGTKRLFSDFQKFCDSTYKKLEKDFNLQKYENKILKKEIIILKELTK